MRFFIIFIINFLFAFNDANIISLLKQIPKNSPAYSLANVLVKKIDSLKPELIKFDIKNIKNKFDYIDKFLELVNLKQKIEKLNNQIDDLQDKINYLYAQNDPVSKLQLIYYQKEIKILKDEVNYLKNHIKT